MGYKRGSIFGCKKQATPEHIYKGYNLLKDVSERTGLKIEFITAVSHLIPQLEMDRFTCPVLGINVNAN